MDFVLTKDTFFLFWMSNLNISVIFAESSHCVSSSHVVSSFTHRCTHLDLQAVGDSCRPRETESRRRVLSTADKTESSLCVSVFSVFSQVTNPLSDSLVCWGYPKNMSVHVSLNDLCFTLSAITKDLLFMPWKMYDSSYATASYSISVSINVLYV